MHGGAQTERKQTTLARDVPAVEIPAGIETSLVEGTPVMITQTLGGNFTVVDDYGRLYRIQGRDADALGEEIPPEAREKDPAKPADEEMLWAELRTIFDPEIPVNVVELGLVYRCELQGQEAQIDMTLTAPGCGMSDVLKRDVETKLAALPGVDQVTVEIVWDPPWDMTKMSEAAKLQLGML